jgi:hypothetical protein
MFQIPICYFLEDIYLRFFVSYQNPLGFKNNTFKSFLEIFDELCCYEIDTSF